MRGACARPSPPTPFPPPSLELLSPSEPVSWGRPFPLSIHNIPRRRRRRRRLQSRGGGRGRVLLSLGRANGAAVASGRPRRGQERWRGRGGGGGRRGNLGVREGHKRKRERRKWRMRASMACGAAVSPPPSPFKCPAFCCLRSLSLSPSALPVSPAAAAACQSDQVGEEQAITNEVFKKG